MSGAWRWWLGGVAVLGIAAAALPLLIFWAELPDPIAVHWSIDLQPDGAMSKRGSLGAPTALIAGVLLLSLINSGTAYVHGRAGRLALVTFGSAIAAATNTTIVARNLGRAAWSNAEPLTIGMLGIQLVAALSLAAVAYLIGSHVWRDVRPPRPADSPALSLAPGARAFWTGSATNRWLVGVGGFLLAQAFFLQALLPQLRAVPIWLAVHVFVCAVLELFSRIVVTIDGRGVAIRYGHLGLWTRRIPLAEIAAAHALTLDALEHGGWGYRGSRRLFGKASIVVRSGPAVRLDLLNGQTLFVTVDDAAAGASLLNALLGREPPRAAATVGVARSP